MCRWFLVLFLYTSLLSLTTLFYQYHTLWQNANNTPMFNIDTHVTVGSCRTASKYRSSAILLVVNDERIRTWLTRWNHDLVASGPNPHKSHLVLEKLYDENPSRNLKPSSKAHCFAGILHAIIDFLETSLYTFHNLCNHTCVLSPFLSFKYDTWISDNTGTTSSTACNEEIS